VETDATRMCQLLVGLAAVTVRGVADPSPAVPLAVEIETEFEGPVRCLGCDGRATVKDRDPVVLVDLPAFGRPTRLRWVKRRWRCPDPCCTVAT
jgi:transposase